MTDPVTMAIAAALATKAVDGLTEAGKTAFAALKRLVRRKLAVTARADTLDEAEVSPDSDRSQRALAAALAHAMANDRHFSEHLVNLWQQVQESRSGVSQGSVLNVATGDIDGQLLQARDIHGNVSFG